MKQQLKDEIRKFIDGKEFEISRVMHPKVEWLQKGHTFLDWTWFMLKFGNEENLRKLLADLKDITHKPGITALQPLDSSKN